MTLFFFFSSRRRHTRLQGDWSSDVCSSDLDHAGPEAPEELAAVELGNRIMDVKNHPRPPTPLRRGDPNHEIGNVVHVNDIDLVPRAKPREQTPSPIEERRVGGQVTRQGRPSIARTLPADQHDAVEPAHPPLAFRSQPQLIYTPPAAD